MRHLIGGLLLLLFTVAAVGQGKAVLALKEQASKMGQAFVKGDYRTFSDYVYPKILDMMGGKDKMVEQLTKMIDEMSGQGMRFDKASFDEPSKMVTSGKELQCVVPQHIEVLHGNQRIVSTTSLIAISTDGGKTWTFIDTHNKDLATLRQLFPNLSNSLVLSPARPPVVYGN